MIRMPRDLERGATDPSDTDAAFPARRGPAARVPDAGTVWLALPLLALGLVLILRELVHGRAPDQAARARAEGAAAGLGPHERQALRKLISRTS